MLERKIYIGTAYNSDEREMNRINREIFNELNSKYKKLILASYEDSKRLTDDVKDSYDIIAIKSQGSWRITFNCIKRPSELTNEEVLLLLANGGLSLGGSASYSTFVVYLD
jgi:phage-related protein